MADETIIVTFFEHASARFKSESQLTVPELVDIIGSEHAPRKDMLRWLKLARFGQLATDKGSLRNDANVQAVSGVEVDYDLEQMSIEQAAQRLADHGVRAILYTSPSHTPEKPRWRVLAPFAELRAPVFRLQMAARLNGVLGGVASKESFTLSQSYYLGHLDDHAEHHQVLWVEGAPIDTLPDLDNFAIGKSGKKQAHAPGANGGDRLAQNAAAELGSDYTETDELLRRIVSGESLRPSVTALAGRYALAGWPIEAAWEVIRGAMRVNPRADYEVREPQELAAIRWVYEREAAKPSSSTVTKENRPSSDLQPLPWIDKSRWTGTPPAQEWTVINRVPARQVCLLSGHGATGKSTIGLQLCICHQLEHRDWLKGLVEPGPAFFIDAEDDEDVIWRRAHDIGNHYSIDVSTLADLHILSMVGNDCVLASVDRAGKIAPTTFYHQLLAAAGDIKPKQIVIASLSNIFGGNEIDRSQVQQFVSLLNRIALVSGGSVIVLSHASLTGL